MDKDIRGEIYGHLSLDEKLQIADIDDIVLYRMITKDIKEMKEIKNGEWLYCSNICKYNYRVDDYGPNCLRQSRAPHEASFAR